MAVSADQPDAPSGADSETDIENIEYEPQPLPLISQLKA